MKSDESIRKVCVAAIKRKTKEPYVFLLSKYFEDEQWESLDREIRGLFITAEEELPVAIVFIDSHNFTLATTRQIVTRKEGFLKSAKFGEVQLSNFGMFKDSHVPFIVGGLTNRDGQVINFFIETGKASMVMIYAIQSLFALYHSIN